MANEQIQKARDLITQKRYAEAREILRRLDTPTAWKWLVKLDEIDPPPVHAQSSGGMNATGITILAVITLLILAIGFYWTFIRPAIKQKWEYLTLSYSQYSSLGSDFAYTSNPVQYGDKFFGLEACGSSTIDADTACNIRNNRDAVFFLNALGNDGWELIDSTREDSYETDFLFKRAQ